MQFFAFTKGIFKKLGASRLILQVPIFSRKCCAFGILVYAMFKMFLKHVLEIHREIELIEIIKYQNVFWSDFCQKWFDFGQILVRFLGKISQIVG